MDPFTIAWFGWGAFFCVVEGWAIATKNWKGTLSNHIRRWICEPDQPQTLWSWTRRITLVSFMGWLTGHFAFGLWG